MIDPVFSEHLSMVEDCVARESLLSDWERGFVDGINQWLVQGRSLSQKQAASLDSIWQRVTAQQRGTTR